MSKSILKNKVVLLLISLFFPILINAQTNIYDTWRIDNIIGIRDLEVYSMVKMGEERFGNMLVLNSDGTFVCGSLPDCGNGIRRNILGHFMLIDETHIRFYLDRIYNKDSSEEGPNIDLGIFYIRKEEKSIRLIRSNGILQDDEDKMLYAEMVDTFDRNWKLYEFSWVNTKANIPHEIVKDYLDKKWIDFTDYKIVFSKKEDYGELFLVREKERFHYVLYNEIKRTVSLAYPR